MELVTVMINKNKDTRPLSPSVPCLAGRSLCTRRSVKQHHFEKMSDLERSRSSMITLSFLQTMAPWLSGSTPKLVACAVLPRQGQESGWQRSWRNEFRTTDYFLTDKCWGGQSLILRSSSSAAHIVDKDVCNWTKKTRKYFYMYTKLRLSFLKNQLLAQNLRFAKMIEWWN